MARFDGDRVDRYLEGYCMRAMDVAADGAVWVLADGAEGRTGLVDLYVITPAAMAVSG